MKRLGTLVCVAMFALTSVPWAGAASVPGYNVEVFATVTDPMMLSFAPSGELYVGRDDSGSGGNPFGSALIHQISADGTSVVEYGNFAAGDPDSVLFDALGTDTREPGSILIGSGNLMVGGSLYAVRPDQSVGTVIAPPVSPLMDVGKMAFDGTGRLLVASPLPLVGDSQVVHVSDGEAAILFTVEGTRIDYLAVDGTDQIYTGGTDGTIRIHGADGAVIDEAFVIDLPGAMLPLAFGPGGDFGEELYTVNNGSLLRIDGSGNVTELGVDLGDINDIAFGGDGNLYLSDFNNDRILRVSPIKETGDLTSIADGLFAASATWSGDGLTPSDVTATVITGHVVNVAADGSALSLTVNGPTGTLAIDAGDTLTVVENVNVDGGTVWMASTGRIDIDGNLTLAPESTLAYELQATQAGQVAVAGDVTIEADTVLQIDVPGTTPFTAGLLTLIDSQGPGGIDGTFAEMTGLGSYATLDDLDYDNGTVTLMIANDLHPGDATLDLTTDVRDFNVWNTNKFTSGTEWISGDFDGNGVTDVRDFNVWNTNKFTSVGAPAPSPAGQVPEPTTLALLACAFAVIAWRRSRR